MVLAVFNIAAPQFIWTEDLDLRLSELVRSSCFDFDLVAASLKQQFQLPGANGTEAKAGLPVTAKHCRLRWADLDAAVSVRLRRV